MPLIKCNNCGSTTNTAVCDHRYRKDDKADRCFVKWKNGKWVKDVPMMLRIITYEISVMIL